MQIQDFARVYESKSDDELLTLASVKEQLTSDAQLALQTELSRRRLLAAEHSRISVNKANTDFAPSSTEGSPQQPAQRKAANFIAEVLRTYHAHFWLFLKLTAPAVIIGTIAVFTARHEAREIARHIMPLVGEVSYRYGILEIFIVNFSAYIVSWMATSFAFGAISIALEEIQGGFTPSAWQSFRNLGERLGPFLHISFLLFLLLTAIAAAAIVLIGGFFYGIRYFHVRPNHLMVLVITYSLWGLALLIFSRFALAIPAVILDDCRVWQAMLRSDKLTEGKWLTLTALLAKSMIGGYVAALTPFWLASLIHVSAPITSWSPWILTSASVICVAVVEPTLFVGFALLYLETWVPEFEATEILTAAP